MKRIKNRVLTIPEIYSGYNAAFQQARDLVSEANLLIEHDRFPGAFHRLVIALEEIGKARLLFYQGALMVGGRAPSWTDFWSEYYKHECKLDAALTWFDLRQLIGMRDAELIDRSLAAIREHARSLDEYKQKTSYSEPTGDGFSTPVTEEFRPRTLCVLRMAKSLLDLADSSQLARATDADEFGEQLRLKYRFAVAVGYSDSASKRDLIEKIAQGNRGISVEGSHLPPDEAFLARVAERYEIIPELIPVTLKQLREDPKLIEFYHAELKDRRGYPDWVILGVLFNLSLRARLGTGSIDDPIYRARLAHWKEDPAVDAPLDASEFTDVNVFETTLSTWLVAFLGALGIHLEDSGAYGENARRVAARHYGFFDRDVDHLPLVPPRTAP